VWILTVYGSVHGSADYGQLNVMQVLEGLEFFEQPQDLIPCSLRWWRPFFVSIVSMFFNSGSADYTKWTWYLDPLHNIFFKSFTEDFNTCVFDML